MNVLIAGCGYLGRFVGTELLSGGSRVWGICRGAASLEKAQAVGIEPIRADLNDPNSLNHLPSVDAVVACQAPSRGESYLDTYFRATESLLRVLKSPKALRFVMVSSTSVYGPQNGGWVDADTLIDPAKLDDDATTLLKTEELVLSSGAQNGAGGRVNGMVLRLSGIYGPGRSRVDSLRSGRVQPTASDAYTNRIHRDDAAAAVIRLLESGKSGQIYLATDDTPATQTEFYGWLCPQLGIGFSPATAPASGSDRPPHAAGGVSMAAASKRCSNAKLKQLGWAPRFPSYKEGYGALLT